MFDRYTVLIVDDHPENLSVISQHLEKSGSYRFVLVEDGFSALEYLDHCGVDLVILDLEMPGLRGDELLVIIKEKYPDLPVLIVTATTHPETIVCCMRNGAHDYLTKPVEVLRTQTAVANALETANIRRNYESLLSNKILKPQHFSHIITQNIVMLEQMTKLEKFAQSPYPVLITGDTGTGKELFAKAVHLVSGRKGKYCTLNVAGVDDQMFSTALFGHRKGAFTGADRSADGIIKTAAGGTLFMDEIGDLSLPSQVKLLRLLQNDEYIPVGEVEPSVSDARIVMATNRRPAELRDEPSFRTDLYYRIAAHHIRIPPLRERTDDIPLLFDFLLQKVADEMQMTKPIYSKEIISLLQSYSFPGNVRELELMVRSVVVAYAGERLLVSHFDEFIHGERGRPGITDNNDNWADSFEVLPNLKEIQEMLVDEALKRSHGKQSVAAKMLGISRSAMSQRLQAKNKHRANDIIIE